MDSLPSVPATPLHSRWRSLLVLGRVSNLPTVWSNCLAAWWLAGAVDSVALAWILIGGTCLYLGGMYFNDYFDTDFDRVHRPERPIPSGSISRSAVLRWGTVWMLAGLAFMAGGGLRPGLLGLLLAATILIYDVVHKRTDLAPLLMAACRFWLFLAALSAGGIWTGWGVWSAVVLFAYIVGLSYLARFESTPGPLRYWPVILLAFPLVLAGFVNPLPFSARALAFGILFGGWTAISLRKTFGPAMKDIGATVSGLLAGIVWVDALAVIGGPPWMIGAFVALFLCARLAQRYIPAT